MIVSRVDRVATSLRITHEHAQQIIERADEIRRCDDDTLTALRAYLRERADLFRSVITDTTLQIREEAASDEMDTRAMRERIDRLEGLRRTLAEIDLIRKIVEGY